MPSFPTFIDWTEPWSAPPTSVPTGTATLTPSGGWAVGYRPGGVTFQVSNTELNPLGTSLPVYVSVRVFDTASVSIGATWGVVMPLLGGTIDVPVALTFAANDIGYATVAFQDYYIAAEPYPYPYLTPAETNTNQVLGAMFSAQMFWTSLDGCVESAG